MDHENDFDFDDEGSTLTLGRTDTPSDINDILQIEIEKDERQQRYQGSVTGEKKDTNESCLSPFFLFLYIFLGCLIIALLGLNFWFGFHLILLIPLFTVIAFLILLLTEFSEIHNLSI